MNLRSASLALVMLLGAAGLQGQIPMHRLSPYHRDLVQDVLRRVDFKFDTRTPPVRVRLATMDRLFDHPRLAAAMWRHCQFVPPMFAFERPLQGLTVDDGMGLRGTLTLVHRRPGMRVYYIEGRVEKGRMGNPMAVGAKMVVTYRYWDGPKGYESYLQTWTALDSALISLVSKPFKSYIRKRQQEFIAYITNNMALGGEFAEINPLEFREPIQREGDGIAIRQFAEAFDRRKR